MRTLAAILLLLILPALNAGCLVVCPHPCCHKCGHEQSLFTVAPARPATLATQGHTAAPAVTAARPLLLQLAPMRVPPHNGPPVFTDLASFAVLRI